MSTVRVTHIDGIIHVAGSGQCCIGGTCMKCDQDDHRQGVHGGYVIICEHCDATEWQEHEDACNVPLCPGYEAEEVECVCEAVRGWAAHGIAY